MDSCDNCGRDIGDLETSYIWRNRTVCAECSQRLQDTVSLAPQISPSITQDPLDALADAVRPRAARPTYIQNVYHQHRGSPRTQTIERTGKVWKAHMLVSFLLVLIGIGIIALAAFLPMPDYSEAKPVVAIAGACVVAVGIVWHIFARMGAWWYHG